jgi:hypothetical protein
MEQNFNKKIFQMEKKLDKVKYKTNKLSTNLDNAKKKFEDHTIQELLVR